MKYIMDNKVCFLDSDELVKKAIPKYIVLDKYVYDKGDIAIIKDEKSVEYFKNRDDILDFEELFCMSKEDFEYKLAKNTKELNKVCERFLDYPVDERFKDKDLSKKYDKLRKLNEDLLDYQKNKDEIDYRFLTAINEYESKIEKEKAETKVKKKSKKKN